MKSELETLKETDHENITKIIQLLENDKDYYIIMEYVGEKDLAELFAEKPTFFTLEQVCYIVK